MIALGTLRSVGTGLARPECVLATARGEMFVSDRRGGVSSIAADGTQRLLGAGSGLLPNGIALCRDGSFLIANLGSGGGVWRLGQDGVVTPFLMEADGMPLAAVNFVRLDHRGRVWICVNVTLDADGRYPTERASGFIVLVDGLVARVVADGIAWANECVLDASGSTLFVNETFGRRTLRFDVAADGSLTRREVFAEFGPGTFPDGIALDEEGGLWIVGVAANRLIRVAPDGRHRVMLEDADPAHLAHLDAALERHALTRTDLVTPVATTLRSLSSIAFGGPDRHTAFLGSIAGDSLWSFQCDFTGQRPVHWDW